jgi:restriction endonuclease S subunit
MSSNITANKDYRQWISKSYFELYTPLLQIVPQVAVKSTSKEVIPVLLLEEHRFIVSNLNRFETLVNDLSQGLPTEIDACPKQYRYFQNKSLIIK